LGVAGSQGQYHHQRQNQRQNTIHHLENPPEKRVEQAAVPQPSLFQAPQHDRNKILGERIRQIRQAS
jgi:hypothetical protein